MARLYSKDWGWLVSAPNKEKFLPANWTKDKPQMALESDTLTLHRIAQFWSPEIRKRMEIRIFDPRRYQ